MRIKQREKTAEGTEGTTAGPDRRGAAEGQGRRGAARARAGGALRRVRAGDGLGLFAAPWSSDFILRVTKRL